ncbi:MAG: T9SS type A sorting domain-containing protein [Fibrobacteres bacterium]|nr:T9SS type A sorting domain-containing protein [Fibrobacterota bacterium]
MYHLIALTILTSIAFSWNPEPDPAALNLQVNVWTKIAEVPADPFGRELEPGQGAYMCYYPDSGKFYRYGGYTPTESNDLYSFSLTNRRWLMEKAPDYSWPSPSNRPGAGPWWSMAYDGKRKVIWMMGGTGSAASYNTLYSDIWKFDPATGQFTKMNSTGYYPGGSIRIVYDSINDRVIRAPAYDGEWSVIGNRDATRCYNPNTNSWESKSTPGSPKNALAAVWVYAKKYGVCVYMVKNADAAAKDSLNCELAETWTYNYATNTWTKLSSTRNPPMRVGAAAAYDPFNDLIIIHGGTGGVKGDYGYAYRGGGAVLEDTWTLDLSTGQWSALTNVGKPVIPLLKATSTTNLLPQLPGSRGRLVFLQAADFDAASRTFVVSSPFYGVWALRLQPSGSSNLTALSLPTLPALPSKISTDNIRPQYPLNTKLLNLQERKWVRIGGNSFGGGEVPLKYDPTSGYLIKYGGCNNSGTTFASGYGNDLTAYDPATEHWLTLRTVDPCGPPRPGNGCTRYYAADEVNGCVWFAGGTAGNILASSIPYDWTGGSGTWRYSFRSDKFELVPQTGSQTVGAGVVCSFDPINKRFIMVPKAYSSNVYSYNSSTSAWSSISATLHAATYTYGDFIDSLGVMGVIESGVAFWTLNSVTGQWDTLPYPTGYSTTARPNLAYDPFNNVVIAIGGGKTFAYTVRNRTWEQIASDTTTPDLGEHLAFDRRHKVFIGSSVGQATYAFKYRNVPNVASEKSTITKGSRVINADPNPFTSTLTLSYHNSERGMVNAAIYSLNGKLIYTLENSVKDKGICKAVWNGRDFNGTISPSGFYVVRIVSKSGTMVKKIIYLE